MKIKGNSLLFFAVLFFVHGFLYSQDYPFPPDTYRSPANPYYWQNRAPSKSYWQQDVHYKILARLNDSLNIIDGDETLTYWNNSPDTLPYVY
ncbi:MAG: M1 family peptidase, partial [Patescibacteria group bacterium]|nr:M1 family peptidase [Patescibacteria group bacterium]